VSRLKEMAGRLNRAQRTRRFKIIASIVVASVAVAAYSSWLVALTAPAVQQSPAAAQAPAPGEPTGEAPEGAAAPQGPPLTTEVIRDALGTPNAWMTVGLATLAALAVALLVIWLGAGLTYLGLLVVAGLIAAPLYAFEATRGLGATLIGAATLAATFTVMLQGVRLLFSADSPVIAVARNAVDEAVRMKISLVFIVLLIFLLAVMPGLLEEEQPLKYRLQSFLQYSVTTTFWVLAMLTLFFTVASVAFEQRDRTIWQTMVKPIAPWQYVLGKWVGVMGLNAALLLVAASGVFLFSQYLRAQPAHGEEEPFVLKDGRPGLTEDRAAVETQVLTARKAATLELPVLDPQRINEVARSRAEAMADRDPAIPGRGPEFIQLVQEMRAEVADETERRYRSIFPGGRQRYTFTGLEAAREQGLPLTLRYKINAGSNDPRQLYRLAMRIGNQVYERQAGLGVTQNITDIPSSAVNEEGELVIEVASAPSNPKTLVFPPEGFEVLYTAGTFEGNFLRVTAVLWFKLAFIAAVSVAAATFLSFPVACLTALLVLFAAETAGFLHQSLQEYPLMDYEGNTDWVAVVIQFAAAPVALAFQTYADLKPTANLVAGRLVAWTDVLKGVLVVSAWTGGTLLIGWLIFRRRELGVYSGH